MSKAISGYNTGYFIHNGGTPGAFDEMGEMFDIEPPDQQTGEFETTHFKSPNRTKEFAAALIDPGEASFQINWLPGDDTDVIIQALKASGEIRSQRIVWPNGVTWDFDGWIKGFKPGAPIEDRMTGAVTVRVTGSTAIS